jgi:hypothetical protein
MPFVSDNLDLAVEYYYAPGSYVSLGHFRKRVDNFLVSQPSRTTFEGLTDPYIGADAEQARAELGRGYRSHRRGHVFQRINENLGARSRRLFGREGRSAGGFQRHDHRQPGDWQRAWLGSRDCSTSSPTPGGACRPTRPSSAATSTPTGTLIGRSFALPGLSDSRNLSVFYENERISTRLAYNWRDEFLGGFDQFGAPVYVEDYDQWDFILTWFATDRLAVFVEGINITKETQRTYSVTRNSSFQPISTVPGTASAHAIDSDNQLCPIHLSRCPAAAFLFD